MIKFMNHERLILASSVAVIDTTITVSDASPLPTLAVGDYIYLTMFRQSDQAKEIIKVTGVSGNDLTVVRAQDDTTALTFISSDSVEPWLNKKILTDLALVNEFEGTEIPDADYDETLGYSKGSVVHYNNVIYECLDASTGSAVWSAINESSGEELLHTEEITSSVATVSFSIPSSATYRRLRIEWDLEHVAGGSYTELFMKLTLNGTKYSAGYKATAVAFNASANSGQNTTANIKLSSTVSNLTTEQSGHVIINNEDGSKRRGYGQFCGDEGNGWVGGVSAFAYDGTDDTEVIDDVEFTMTNNFTGGKFRVYGIQD